MVGSLDVGGTRPARFSEDNGAAVVGETGFVGAEVAWRGGSDGEGTVGYGKEEGQP